MGNLFTTFRVILCLGLSVALCFASFPACSRQRGLDEDSRSLSGGDGILAVDGEIVDAASPNIGTSETGVLSCCIRIEPSSNMALEYKLTDISMIQNMVLAPLTSAEQDLQPARYVVLGNLTVERDGETIEESILFLPFGHIKRHDDYYVVDFSKLGNHLASWLARVETVLPALQKDLIVPKKNGE